MADLASTESGGKQPCVNSQESCLHEPNLACLHFLLDMLMCCRDDVLPCRAYLRHCILASKNLGQEAYDSFMDHTFLVQMPPLL